MKEKERKKEIKKERKKEKKGRNTELKKRQKDRKNERRNRNFITHAKPHPNLLIKLQLGLIGIQTPANIGNGSWKLLAGAS